MALKKNSKEASRKLIKCDSTCTYTYTSVHTCMSLCDLKQCKSSYSRKSRFTRIEYTFPHIQIVTVLKDAAKQLVAIYMYFLCTNEIENHDSLSLPSKIYSCQRSVWCFFVNSRLVDFFLIRWLCVYFVVHYCKYSI